MEIKDLKKLLESAEVKITFKSLKSGRVITEKCSLNKNLIPEGYSFNQSGESDSVLCYLTEKKRWEDIKNSTIIKYEVSVRNRIHNGTNEPGPAGPISVKCGT